MNPADRTIVLTCAVTGIAPFNRKHPADAHWAALGIGRREMQVVAQVAMLGGNVRIGLEDNLCLRRGVFATNGELVVRARTILDGLGHDLATPAEARQILGLTV